MDIEAQESLGQKVKRLRRAKKMSQKELADEFVTVSMISQVERGVKQASVELLQHIAKKLQVPLHELAKMEAEQMETAWRHKLAKAYLAAKQPEEAVPLLLELRGRSDLSYATGIEVAVDYAECLYLQGMYAEVLELLLPLNEELIVTDYDDAHMRALVQFVIGNCYYKLINYVTANYYYRSAADLTMRFVDFDHLAARISFKTGTTLQLMGNDKEAILYLNRAFDYFHKNENLYRLASTMMVQGISHKNMQNYVRASENLSTAIGIFQGLNLTQELYDVQVTLAATITVRHDPDLALQQLRECIEVYQSRGSNSDLVLAYSKYAVILLDVGRVSDAFNVLRLADSVVEEYSLPPSPSVGACYQILAKYYMHQRMFESAIVFSLKSASVFDTIGLIADQVESLQIACDAYHDTGDDAQAFNIERTCSTLLKQLYGRRERIL